MNATPQSHEEESLAATFPDDKQNLDIFCEEVGEVAEQINLVLLTEIQKNLSRIVRIKGKIDRFGIDDYHPKNKVCNRAALEIEIGQMEFLIKLLKARQYISSVNTNLAAHEKASKMAKWYVQDRLANQNFEYAGAITGVDK